MKNFWLVRYRTTESDAIYSAKFSAVQTKEQIQSILRTEVPGWKIVSIVHVTDAERQKTPPSGGLTGVLLVCLLLAGCAAPVSEDGPDTSQKWSRTHGYNFGTGPLSQTVK